MKREKVDYRRLNARQKENHVVAARLALYGYNSLRLTDDDAGADFLAIHRDDRVFVYDHDAIIPEILAVTSLDQTVSWSERGAYSWTRLPVFTETLLADHELCP